MKTSKKILLFLLTACVLFLSALGVWLSEHYVTPILMYHIVDDTPKPEPNWVKPELFDHQMAYLKKNRYKVISLQEYVDAVKEQKRLPRRSVVITFDDGYEDNYRNAFPILKKYNFPATIFLVSSWVDTKGFLTVAQIHEMHSAGIDFGAHSRTHPHLPSLSNEEQEKEIVLSKKELEEKLGRPIKLMAYPFGGHNEQIKQIVKNSGYDAAVTTNRGFSRFQEDRYALKRIRLSDKDNKDYILWMKFLGYYNLLRKPRSPGEVIPQRCPDPKQIEN